MGKFLILLAAFVMFLIFLAVEGTSNKSDRFLTPSKAQDRLQFTCFEEGE